MTGRGPGAAARAARAARAAKAAVAGAVRRPGGRVRAAVAGAVLLAAAAGFALGDVTGAGDPDGVPASAAPGAPGGSKGPAADSADAGFARDMAVHHQQAVEMSFIVRDRTGDEDVRRLAYDIAQTQANQRGMLLGWLELWGLPKVSADPPMTWMGMAATPGADGALMPGMATDTQLDRLRKADGRQAEILYLQLMTEHHRGGIHMARACADACTVPAERRLAQGMVSAQQSEIDAMATMLKDRGAKAAD